MASFPSVSEQFIQDVVSHPDRLLRMLKEQAVGKESWFFDPDEMEGDVVNQEYAVGAGRIDVIATFSRRTRLLVVETKAGIADLAALNQLKWYLKPEQLAALRRDRQLADIGGDNVIGFVVAQEFSGIPRPIPVNIHLFRCVITDVHEEPTLVYVPPENLPESIASEDEAAPAPRCFSQLNRLSDHVNYIGSNNALPQEVSKRLHDAFRRFLRCFLEEKDATRWVYPNAKGAHIWVHYKGVLLIYLQSARKWFDVQYGLSPKRLRISAGITEEAIRECADAIYRDLAVIDDEVRELFDNPAASGG